MAARHRLRLLPSSVRFRLTAWYALLLAVVLATLGFLVLGLTRDQLRADGEARLKKTAYDIEKSMLKDEDYYSIAWRRGQPTLVDVESGLDGFEARGLLVQICDASGRVIKASPSAPKDHMLLTATPGSGEDGAKVATVAMDDGSLRVVQHPIRPKEYSYQPIGTIFVGERLDNFYRALDSLRNTLLTTSLAGLAFAIVGGWVLADRALRPVDRVTATAARIASGDGSAASLSTRLAVPGSGDEMERLSSTFNAMLDRLEASFRAQQRFVADASHELRTPLTAIRGNVEVLARQIAAVNAGRPDPDLDAAVADMKRESARMGRLLDDLLLLARSDAPGDGTTVIAQPPRPVRLDRVAQDAVRTAQPLVAGQRLEVVAPEPVTVAGDPDRLLQLVLILLENAVRHTPAGHRIRVEVAPPERGAVRLVVRDEGEGIAPEHLPHLFDRFYRADGARGRATGGTGLGLAIARAIVRAHGGEIAVASTPGRGSTFTVTLPAAGPLANPAP